MLNTKLGFFYVHRFARFIYEVTRFIYETYGCLFPTLVLFGYYMLWFGDLYGKQAAVRVSVNLPVTAKP